MDEKITPLFWVVTFDVATGMNEPHIMEGKPKRKWAIGNTHFFGFIACQRQCDRINKTRGQHG